MDHLLENIKNDFVVKDESSTEKSKMESTVENIVDKKDIQMEMAKTVMEQMITSAQP